MTKLFSLAILALTSSVLAASPAPADCTKRILVDTISVDYTSKASFPDEPKRIGLDFEEFSQGVSLCGFKFAPAKGRLKITGGSLTVFTRLFPEVGKPSTRMAIGNFYAPAQGMGSGPRSYLLFDVKTYRLSYNAPEGSSSPFVLGATVDGGPVQRLYYQGKVSAINVPRNAKAVDVYVNTDQEVLSSWQRVTLDLKGKAITLHDEAKFPSK